MKLTRTFYVLVFLTLAALCGCSMGPAWKHEEFALSVPADAPAAASSSTNIVALGNFRISPLFQGRSFTCRTGENSYERDPYAGFLESPEHALEEPIRAYLRNDGIFGRVVDPGSALTPSVVIEASVNALDGDFRDALHPVAEMTIHFIVYEVGQNGPGRVLLDKDFSAHSELSGRSPVALVAAWDKDLREIMNDLNSDYGKADLNDR
jgi:ABC-type uncharacterized transport system auxiliary subunit